MDAVKAFNVEMLSMMDMKPPISRAKMMSITKAGIKAIKLYKHVVQIIEKFIKRCGPELKVPGLYVVDSIIRQSRHQFGEDKDVFGPRFLKNMADTFHSLYQCPPDDKTKILRVLNLWQKNSVFGMDVIQPLLDMASAPVTPVLENGVTLGGSPAAQLPSVSVPITLHQPISTGVLPEPPNPAALPQLPQLQIPVALPQLPQLQNPAALPQLHQLHQLPQLHNPVAQHQLHNPAALPQLHNPVAQPPLQNPTAMPPLQNPAALAAVTQFLQSTQGFNLQQVLQTLQQGGANAQPAAQTSAPAQQKSSIAKVLLDRFDYDEEPDVVEEPIQEETPPAVSAAVNLEALQQALQAHLLSQLSSQVLPNNQPALQSLAGPQSVTGFVQTAGQPYPDFQVSRSPGPSETIQTQNYGHIEAELPDIPLESRQSRRDERDARYSRRSRSRSPRRRSSSHSRRSGSGSRSHSSRFRRSRSRSRERRRASPRRRAEDRRAEDRRERDRRHKGLPPIRRETLSVCSTTLWIGQLDKKTQQQDITSLMEEFGQIESVNMIPPRGCAYIVMVHRQDAHTALSKLSRGSARINHKPFKVAWALNKGVNSRFKKYWDVELGVTYIPWSKLKTAEIPALREGGTLDQDTFKPEWAPVLGDLLKPVGDNGERPEGGEGEEAAAAAAAAATAAAIVAAGPQVLAVNADVARSPAAGTPAVTTPPLAHTAPEQPEVPSANPSKGTENQADSPRALLTTSPPAGTLVGARPGSLQQPAGPLLPFGHSFPSNAHPSVPLMNVPPMRMPQGPMFRERPPRPTGPMGPVGPQGPLGPPGRFRMPMRGPHEDFPHPREGFQPPRERFPPLREGFPHSGPMEEEHWDQGPFRNDWNDHGPNRGPEWFGDEPPFRRGGWGRGGPRGRGRFGN
ncbi:SR-related and CTD-associated factor 4-like [Salminus brasiliensis]|uniref:SR-related and CTD-associated factor 4-like n=1 Tax=Salminus brasiliensis TaxID=930266 RepID=UPI003B837E38